MVCRALLAAAAVTYILCVLLLSGIQKEDLAESTLEKLQRHNVNIDHLNNEELREKCRKMDVNKEYDITTTAKHLNLETVGSEYDQDIHTKNNINDKRKDNYNTINESLRRYIEGDNKESKQKETVLYDNVQPKLNSIMTNKADVTQITNLTNIISQILTNIFREKQIKNTQQTVRNVGSDLPYLENTPDDNKKNIYEQLIDNNKYVINSLANRDSSKTKRPEFEMQYPTELNNIKIPNELFHISMSEKENRRFYVPENSFSNHEFKQNNDMHKAEPIKLPNTIPVNVINDIAERLKVIILKDLKKELNIEQYHTTTSRATTRTQLSSKSPTTTTIKRGHAQNTSIEKGMILQEAVLQNFLKLFEQMKNLKTNINNTKQYYMDTNIEIISEKNLAKPKFQTTNSNVNGRLKVDKKITSYQEPQELNSNYNFRPQMHKYRTDDNFKKQVKQERKNIVPVKGKPVTFQTNLFEIPPLSIILDRFQNPINQNIILTTTAYKLTGPTANEKTSNDVLKLKKNPQRFDYYNRNDQENNDNVYETIKYLTDDIKNYKDNNYFANERNERIIEAPRIYENLDENMKIKMKTHFVENLNLDKIDCCKSRHVSQLIEDCCNDRIKSRQQISLNNMKNRKNDESHIKNFINSQRKVNDMLEKLLATRNKYRSIEQV